MRLAIAAMFSLFLTATTTTAPTALAAPLPPPPPGAKIHHTYPQPPSPKPADPMRVAPGFGIPMHPEYYTWRITNKMPNGKVLFKDTVPLYRLRYLERAAPRGEVAVGTPVKLEESNVQRLGNVMYFSIPAADADPAKPVRDPDDMLWVNGMFIEPVSYNPPPGAR